MNNWELIVGDFPFANQVVLFTYRYLNARIYLLWTLFRYANIYLPLLEQDSYEKLSLYFPYKKLESPPPGLALCTHSVLSGTEKLIAK